MATCGDHGGTNSRGEPCGARTGGGPCWRHSESAESKNVGGRPSSYRNEYAGQAFEQCLLGATDATLAEYFGVAESTINEWKKQYPEFSESVKRGKAPADGRIASALYERAAGAEWVEEQAFKLKTVTYDNGKKVREEERIEVVEVTRRAPPDTPAAIFWLKNRRPDVWRDKQNVEADVNLNTPSLTVVVKRGTDA